MWIWWRLYESMDNDNDVANVSNIVDDDKIKLVPTGCYVKEMQFEKR